MRKDGQMMSDSKNPYLLFPFTIVHPECAEGSDYECIRKTYLHTIGNLTLSGYNQELYNKPYPQERERATLH